MVNSGDSSFTDTVYSWAHQSYLGIWKAVYLQRWGYICAALRTIGLYILLILFTLISQGPGEVLAHMTQILLFVITLVVARTVLHIYLLFRSAPVFSAEDAEQRAQAAKKQLPAFTDEEKEEVLSLMRLSNSALVSYKTTLEEMEKSMNHYEQLAMWPFLHDIVRAYRHFESSPE